MPEEVGCRRKWGAEEPVGPAAHGHDLQGPVRTGPDKHGRSRTRITGDGFHGACSLRAHRVPVQALTGSFPRPAAEKEVGAAISRTL